MSEYLNNTDLHTLTGYARPQIAQCAQNMRMIYVLPPITIPGTGSRTTVSTGLSHGGTSSL